MADITLPAQTRTAFGKKVGALRREGLVPGNIYGQDIDSVAVQVDSRDFRDALLHAGMTTVVNMVIDGDRGGARHPVLIEKISTHPSTGKVLHVDLRRVNLSRPVRASIPVVVTGEAPASQIGGVLFTQVDVIDVEALPGQLPQQIEVDVSGLEIIDSQISVGDLKLPEGVSAVTNGEIVVVRVVASKLEQEVAAEAAETAEAAVEAAEAAGTAEGADVVASTDNAGGDTAVGATEAGETAVSEGSSG